MNSDESLLDESMPFAQLRLHMGELTYAECMTARAAIKWANRKAQAALLEKEAEIARLLEALKKAKSYLQDEPEYHDQGMGCGLEDRCITDRYEAMAFGWKEAMDRVYGEHIQAADEAINQALQGDSKTREDDPRRALLASFAPAAATLPDEQAAKLLGLQAEVCKILEEDG